MTTDDAITYAPLERSREPEAKQLVLSVFDAMVAPGFSEQGRRTFHDFVRQIAFSRRSNEAFALAALRKETVVGVIDVVNGSHISLLFVSPDCQGCGIGRGLVLGAVEQCRERNPNTTALTVNASPNAVLAYSAMGFAPTGREQERDGIRFLPMTLLLD